MLVSLVPAIPHQAPLGWLAVGLIFAAFGQILDRVVSMRAELDTVANLSILKNGHARAIRFNTLTAICDALGCTPGDLLGLQR